MGSAECQQAPATDVVGSGSTAPAEGPSPRLRGGHRLGRWGLAVLLALAAALTLLPIAPAAALSWPWGTPATRPADAPPTALAPQEIAPPLGVQQLRPLLEVHQPRLRIVSPQADSLVPAGPWTLQLELSDWPLLDAGPGALGPHLVVQLDEAPPLRLTATSVVMPPLAPGSHRLSVFAALPWGEAMRNPGAFAQIRLHRSAANPLAGPAPGTPQLIPLLPVSAPAHQPLLLDWILLDAPLQHLRGDDDSWRLRISLDGQHLLLDRQEALWLRGLSPGRHPLVLELLDPRGEPLNPPFNSLVRELVTSTAAPSPPWLAGPLSTGELAQLSGAAPPPAEAWGAARPAERQRDQNTPAVVGVPTSAIGSPGGASQPEAGADPRAAGPSRQASPRRSARDEPGLDDASDRVLDQPGSPESSADQAAVAASSRDNMSIGPKGSNNGGTSSSSGAASPRPAERGPIAPWTEPIGESPLDAGAAPNPRSTRLPQSQQSAQPDRQPMPPDQRSAPRDEPPRSSPIESSQVTTVPMESPGSALPAASPTLAAPKESPQTTRSAPSPQAQPSAQPLQQPMPPIQRPPSNATPSNAEPSNAEPSPRSSPRSSPNGQGADSAEPLGADPDTPPLAPLPSGEGTKGEADRPSRSRSVNGEIPSPSLSPRPSPPEPFDPWSSPLAADLSARPRDSNGPLQRLGRLASR